MDFEKKPLGTETRSEMVQPVQAEPVRSAPAVTTEKPYPRKRMLAWRIFVTVLLVVATGLLVAGWFYVQDLYAQLDKKDTEIAQLQSTATAYQNAKNETVTTSKAKLTQKQEVSLAGSEYYCTIENFGCDKVTATITKIQEYVADGASRHDGFAIVSAGNSAGVGTKLYLKSIDGLSWVVIYDGQDTPPQAIVDKFAIPKDFL